MDSELPSSPRHLPAGTETICLLVSELISILIYLTPRLPTTPMDVPFDRRERSEATINEWQQPVNIISSIKKHHTCPQPKKLLLQTRREAFEHQHRFPTKKVNLRSTDGIQDTEKYAGGGNRRVGRTKASALRARAFERAQTISTYFQPGSLEMRARACPRCAPGLMRASAPSVALRTCAPRACASMLTPNDRPSPLHHHPQAKKQPTNSSCPFFCANLNPPPCPQGWEEGVSTPDFLSSPALC